MSKMSVPQKDEDRERVVEKRDSGKLSVILLHSLIVAGCRGVENAEKRSEFVYTREERYFI